MERLRGAGAAILCFATVTAALLSWSSFTIDDRHYLLPALVIGLVVLAVGVVCRGMRMHGAVVALAQLAAGMLATSTFLSGAPIPLTAASRARLSDAFAECGNVIQHVFPPMPVQHGIAPLLVPGALLAYWVADVLACTMRRPSLAGLVFLGIFTVPFSVIGGGVRWSVFAITAAGFLGLLAVQESERVGRWGRRLGDDTPGAISGAGDQSRASTPLMIGVAAVALAIAAPSFVPTMSLDFSSWGAGGNKSHQPITVTNPMVGMYGSLKQQSDQGLVQVQVTGGVPQRPEYLRVAVLTKFDGTQWSTGDRSIPTDHTAHQSIPVPAGVPLGGSTSYSITTLPSFNSAWLPTFDFTTRIDAIGDWRFDTDTYDFISADPSMTTAGLTYADTAAPIDPTKEALEHAPFDTSGVPASYTQLPAGWPSQVTAIAVNQTDNQPTPFLQAVALQDWFTKTGGFRYSLTRAGDGNNDLLHFVTDNKVGYCQQFATAMAAMARAIGIPARVAVGFLHAVPVPGAGNYLFRGQDMHAWPELWFKGVGWVRFEPTPGVGASIPSYTQGVKLVGAVTNGGGGIEPPVSKGGTKKGNTHHGQEVPKDPKSTTPAAPQVTTTGHHRSWAWAWTLLALLLVAGLLAAPYWIRRRRRHQRLAGGVEDAWAELHDTVRDLGLPWTVGASPRDQASRLGQYVGGGEPWEALGRLVIAVERTRYARTPGSSAAGQEAAVVIARLEQWVERGDLRRARLLPRSLFSTDRARRQASAERESERRLVDRVG